jgi:hypothetical protein
MSQVSESSQDSRFICNILTLMQKLGKYLFITESKMATCQPWNKIICLFTYLLFNSSIHNYACACLTLPWYVNSSVSTFITSPGCNETLQLNLAPPCNLTKQCLEKFRNDSQVILVTFTFYRFLR